MTGQAMVRWSAFVGESRAQAGIEARRYGVPSAMIEAATERRSAGDWRGACAAADVECFFDPEKIRRLCGAEVASALLDDLRTLAPDLLRWHLPRYAHGSGRLLGGLLVPLAGYGGTRTGFTLAAATPGFALTAGERIVLTVLETGSAGARSGADAGGNAVLVAVVLGLPLDFPRVRNAAGSRFPSSPLPVFPLARGMPFSRVTRLSKTFRSRSSLISSSQSIAR